jgi:uncharacterized protein YndB with AHSA1/START domain
MEAAIMMVGRMKHLRTSIEISAEPELVWRLLTEFEHWPTWGPSVRAVESDAPVVAPGVKGRVQTPLRFWVPFEITEVTPGRSWSWKVAGIPATGHEIREVATDGCRVTFSVSPLLMPYLLILRIGLRRLKRLAEDG